MIKINLYSLTPLSFTIQFQTLIFVIFANRANVRVVRKILEIWCTCNILVKPCIISSFFTLFTLLSLPVSEHSIYLCSNYFELPMFSFYVFAFTQMSEHLIYLCLNSFELPMFSLRLCIYTGSFLCFCTCFCLTFCICFYFAFTR